MRARTLLFAAVALGSLSAGCRGKPAPAPAASASLPEVTAPDALVAELSIGNPKQTWLSLRQLGGDAARALPSSLPVLLATSLSLPPAAAGNIDEGVPLVGAVLVRPGSAEPEVVLGMHVVSGAELVASLTLGDAAKYRRLELGPRVVRLVSAPGAPEPDGALGVSGNYLLLASRPDALKEAGRFVAESVARRARQEPGLSLTSTGGVLAGTLSRRLRELWQARRGELAARARLERQSKGRPADFADPEALLAGADGTLESWLAVLESSRGLSFQLTPEPGSWHAELALTPQAEGAAAQLAQELVVGPTAPLFRLPQATSGAILWRGDAAPQTADGGTLAASLDKLFGSRLSAEHSKKLGDTLARFAKTRHGASVLALVPAPAPSALLTFEVDDAEGFGKAFGDVLRLLDLPPVSSWLSSVWGKPSVTFSPPASDGSRHARVRFARLTREPRSLLPGALSLSWQARDGVGQVLVSADEATDLGALSSLPRLDKSAFFAPAQRGLGDQTALALLADVRLLVPQGPDDAPLLLAFGKKDDRITVTLDVAAGVLPAVARAFAVDRSP